MTTTTTTDDPFAWVGWRPGAAHDPTLQQVFDYVATHLLTQRAKAMFDGEGCAYLDQATGRKCAVGCLIPTYRYDRNFEGLGWIDDRDPAVGSLRRAVGAWATVEPAKGLLGYLQLVHDEGPDDASDWPKRLTVVAQRHGLKVGPELRALLETFEAFVPVP